ncbi:MAG: histidine kinase [Gemmatimonadetes bacterium]|nr:histidine kinase [Gemmatimonadota bacterium]
MSRTWIWLQIIIGWLPVWGLFALLVVTAHDLPWPEAALIGGRMVLAGVPISPLVSYTVRRLPWPQPMQVRFVAWHLVAASGYAACWFVTNSLIESLVRWQPVLVIGYALGPFLVMGVWLYVMQAGIGYASAATSRAGRAEAAAAEAQLAALRGQLNPHFLFNALHTVAQLAPMAPERAARAAEDVAGLLRTSLGAHRDQVPLADEWAFVRRYLDIERIRFGDRLRVEADVPPEVQDCEVPAFALQTLVENAVRHGAGPRVEPTTLTIRASRDGGALVIEVRDDGAGTTTAQLASAAGTGLRRLRQRLDVLHGAAATLDVRPLDRGVHATLRLPVHP